MLLRGLEELRAWYWALLEAMPGEIGCTARRYLYGFKCGKGTRVLSKVTIYHPHNVILGNHVGISCSCQLNGAGGIVIGDHVLLGPGVMVWSQNHAFRSLNTPIAEQGYERATVTIQDDCWIGAGAIVLAGVCLGHGTVVAAGAVVTKSTEPFSIVAGVPAKIIGSRLRDSGDH
jgi:maltose O-acetyltransferase